MKPKPKVLFIGPLPPPYSGPELSMQQFLESEILREDFEITFLQTNFRKKNSTKGKFGGGMVLNFFAYFFGLFQKLVTGRPDLVYYPITATQVGWLGRDALTILLCRLFKAKVLIHLRGSHFMLNYKGFKPLAKKITGFALEKVDSAIVQADYLRTQFTPYIDPKDVSVLYQAMDPKEFYPGPASQIQEGKILIIGHMTKAKGYTDILKVIPEIAQEFPQTQFCFAGEIRKGERGIFYNQFSGEALEYEDPFEAEQDILQGPFQKNYRNLGLVYGKEKLEHFHTADVFLSASYSEGFSRALLEAMSCGKPLVYTPVGAHREVLGPENGISFTPGDLTGLAESLLTMLRNPTRQKIGHNNRAYLESTFTVEQIVRNFRSIIQKTLEK